MTTFHPTEDGSQTRCPRDGEGSVGEAKAMPTDLSPSIPKGRAELEALKATLERAQAANAHSTPFELEDVAFLIERAEAADRAEAERDAWEQSAAQFHRNEEYYRGLVQQIGATIGPEAYTADDGGVHTDVLCAKVPELVSALTAERDAAVALLREAKVSMSATDWPALRRIETYLDAIARRDEAALSEATR